MTKQELARLTNLTEQNERNSIYNEICLAIDSGRVLIHNLGLFDTANIINIYKDKIALQVHKIQFHETTVFRHFL